MIALTQAAFDAINADAARWRKLVALCGYYQDATDVTVRLYQDEVERVCCIGVGSGAAFGYAASFEAALDSIK